METGTSADQRAGASLICRRSRTMPSPLRAAPTWPRRVPEDAQAVREGMARLLEGEAELLVVDDLSAVLSMEEERMLWDALFARRLFWRQGACLAVSNRQPALSRADHIVVLVEGRVVGEGRLEELLRTCAEMQRYLGKNRRSRFLA